MPELPEVETIRRDLLKKITGHVIEKVTVLDSRVLRNMPAADFARACAKRTVTDVSRRGKAVIIHLSGAKFLIVQPMMTGYLLYVPAGENHTVLAETKIVFQLSNAARFIYNDQRIFGRVQLVSALDEVAFLKTLGPEPFSPEFNPQWMKERFKGRKGSVKNLLLDQHIVAGIGNIYASEILFRSGVCPQRPAGRLSAAEVERICRHTREILEDAVHRRGTSMRNYRDTGGAKGSFMSRIQVYGRAGEKCFRCGAPVLRIVQGGRSSFFCKMCQK